MKPLIILIGTFGITLLATYYFTETVEYRLAGKIAMSAMLLFTVIGHFIFTKGMTMMVPDFIPFKKELVYLTGIFEIIAGVGLLIPSLAIYAGWALIVFFTLLLPANIKAALHHIDYQKGTFNGNGPNYLWFRIPLQVLFILWTYISSIKF